MADQGPKIPHDRKPLPELGTTKCPVSSGGYRCQLAAGHAGRHSARPVAPGGSRMRGRLKAYGNHCRGCGVSIEDGVTLCPGCADKFKAAAGPLASILTAAQPAPAYQRPDYDGNFPAPKPEPEPEAPAE